MNIIPSIRTLNTITSAAMLGSVGTCVEELKCLAQDGLEFASNAPNRLKDAKESISGIWSTAKTLFKSIEPYQPWAAGAMIIGKAIWKTTTKSQIKKDIKDKQNRLVMLKHLHNCGVKDFSGKILKLENAVRSRKDDLTHSALSVAQLGSLFFSHPGSNIWNSLNTLYGRLFSLRNTNLTNAPMPVALGSISALGTTTSLLKITGIISGEHPLSHLIIGTSFVGMAIESGLMIKSWLFR